MPLKSAPSLIALLIASLYAPAYAQTTAPFTAPVLKASSTSNFSQGDCFDNQCIVNLTWTPPPAGDAASYEDSTYSICEEDGNWNCGPEIKLDSPYSNWRIQHPYEYTEGTETPPPATKIKRYKLIRHAVIGGENRSVESQPIDVPLIQPIYYKYSGKYYLLAKYSESATSPGISFSFNDNGQKQEVIEIVNPSQDIGTSVKVTAVQPPSGSLVAEGMKVYFTPPPTPSPYERRFARIVVANISMPGAVAAAPSVDNALRLFSFDGAGNDPIEFAAVPLGDLNQNFTRDGYKYTYTPTGAEGTKTVFNYNASQYYNTIREKFSIVQTSGSFCPVFSRFNDMRDYLDANRGQSRTCLVEDVNVAPASSYEKFYTSDGRYITTPSIDRLVSEVTLPSNVADGYLAFEKTLKVYEGYTVVKTIPITYGVNVVTPYTFTAEVIDKYPKIVIAGMEFYLVPNKTEPGFEYKVTGGNPDFLKIEGSNVLPAELRRFEYASARMLATDSRVPYLDKNTEIIRYLLNVEKETVPISTSNRNTDGTVRVLVNPTRMATGNYLLTLKRRSSANGSVSIPDENKLIKVGPAPSSTPITYNQFEPTRNRILDSNNRVAEIMLPKALVDDLLATGDALFFEALAHNPQFTETDMRASEETFPGTFADTLEISGLTGYISTPPSGEFNLTNLYSIQKKSANAYLINLKSSAKVDWLIQKEGAALKTFTKEPAGDLDLSELDPGVYQITPKLYAINNSLSTLLPSMTFVQYAQPVASFTYQPTMVIGTNNNLLASVSNVPPNAIATWRIGDRTVPGVVSPDGKTITGVYVPVASRTAETLTLEIQINPDTLDAIAKLSGPVKVNSVDTLNPDISTSHKVFWSKKGGTFDYKGTADTNKIDWIVTDPQGVVVKTKTIMGRGAFNTTGLLPGDYVIKAKAYDKYGSFVESKSLPFRVLLEPVAVFRIPMSVVAGSTMALVGLTNNVAEGSILTWNIGDTQIPASLNDERTQVTGTFNVPLVPTNYRSTLSIQVDPTNTFAVKTFDMGTIKATGYAKLTASVEAPRFLDVGTPATYKGVVKAPWDLRVLPVNSDTLHTEWEMPDGTRIPGSTLTFTPTMQDYPLFLAGKRPIFRAWMVDDKLGTQVEFSTTATMYEPWVFPTYSLLEKAGSANVIAPSAVVISAVPRESVLPAMASYRGIKYEWSFPDAPGFTVSAKKELLSMTINEPGTYPVSVRVSDKYGAEQVLQYQVTASKAQFSISKMNIFTSPERPRVPTYVAMRVDVSSTHKKERLKNYQTFADGILVGTGTSPKATTLTTAGDHEVTLVATSTLGSVVSRTEIVTVAPNNPPSCQPFKLVFGTSLKMPSVKANANCSDSDGKIKKYVWKVNGEPTKSTQGTQSYVFQTPDPVDISVTVTDDSGDSTTYSETIHM